MESETGPQMEGEGRVRESGSPDGSVAGLKSEGTSIPGLTWAVAGP